MRQRRRTNGSKVGLLACLAVGFAWPALSGCTALHGQSTPGANVYATVDGSGRVVERGAEGQREATAPDRGKVEAIGQGEELRLSFLTATGQPLKSSSFTRRDSENSPQVLRRGLTSPYSVGGLPGTYRAELRDADGASAGWLQVRILRYVGLPRQYEGDVPPALQGPLFADAVALLDAEISAMIQRSAVPEDRYPEGLVP